MKNNPAVIAFGFVALFCLSACQSTQGPVGSGASSAPSPTGPEQSKEIQPAPTSRSFPAKKDVFQGAEFDEAAGVNLPANARQLRLRVGEIVEVYRGSAAIGDKEYERAFYLPPEARAIAQLVVETKGLTRTYFIRAIGEGESVGGVVERRWLNGSGNSTDGAAEARVQAAVKAAPYLISIRS